MPVKMGPWFLCLKKGDFNEHFNIFVFFFFNFMSKPRVAPFLNNPPFIPALLFLEKIFHPHSYCQIRGSQFTPCKREQGLNYI